MYVVPPIIIDLTYVGFVSVVYLRKKHLQPT